MLYWACLRSNFFKLRESLNVLSMIMLLLLVSTGFIIPFGENQEYIKFIIIALCVGIIIDLWLKDRGLKQLLRLMRLELDELRRTQQNTAAFLMDIAHKLKSPLAVVGGLLHGVRARNTTEQVKIDQAAAVADQLQSSMKNLVFAGQLDHGQAELQCREIDLTATLNEWRGYLAALLPHHRLDWLLPDRPLRVYGDTGALKDALTNLVDNARKYSPEGSIVTVSLAVDGCNAVISVIDKGRGISLTDRRHVFDRHWQSKNRGLRGDGSAGLGLSLVRWTARQHGGDAGVRSQLGQGSRFFIWIPLLYEEDEIEPQDAPEDERPLERASRPPAPEDRAPTEKDGVWPPRRVTRR